MPPLPPLSNVSGSQNGKVRSMVWNHFSKIPKGDPTKPRAAYNYYGVSYTYDAKINSTKFIKYHIEKQCKKCQFKNTDKSQMTLSWKVEGGSGSGGLVLIAFSLRFADNP
ncbi:hypothetical protein I3760_05G067400 [Carya illinoinensis]|nr:hypothetical protein I3760_05G067400 [Carya illinoinensis]